MKKVIAIVLAAVMVLAFASAALADETKTTDVEISLPNESYIWSITPIDDPLSIASPEKDLYVEATDVKVLVNHQLIIEVSSDNYADDSFNLLNGSSSVKYDLKIDTESLENNDQVLVKKGEGLAKDDVTESVCIIASTDAARINEATSLGIHADTLTFTSKIDDISVG